MCQVEAVLDLYHEPYDATRPVVCFDERPCQLLADVRAPLPMCASRAGEGQSARPVAREDYEYRRQGTTNVLLAVEPLTGQRIWVRPRRRKAEFAEVMRELADEVTIPRPTVSASSRTTSTRTRRLPSTNDDAETARRPRAQD